MESNPEQSTLTPTPQQAPEHAAPKKEELKTIAVRVEESLHAQLQFIAQLGGNSITDEVRAGIEHRIARAQEDPVLIAKAQEARERIERQAALRSAAILGFIGLAGTEASPDAEPTAKDEKQAPAPEQAPSAATATRPRRPARGDKGSA